MENELMTMEENEIMDDAVVAEEKSGIGTGAAMLIGAGLTLAVTACVKLAKKGIKAIKAKKEAKNAKGDYVQVDDEPEEDVEAK